MIFFTGQREFALTEKIGAKKNIGLITLNRPKALNALSDDLMRDVSGAIDELENDKEVGVLVLTGSGKAFAAGINDIKLVKYYLPGNCWLLIYSHFRCRY